MINDKINRTNEYFDYNINAFKEEMLKLKADERQDESVFVRVKMNVYDIFRTVFATSLKLNADDEKKITEFFLKKTEEIPANWRTSLSVAEKHGEMEKAHLEEIKLNAAKSIEENFKNIWKEN